MTPNQVAPTVSLNATISAATMGTLAEGAHAVHVHSRDALGNWDAFSTATLGVDKTGPAATGVSAIPSPNNGTLSATSTTQSVRVDVTLNDPLIGMGGGIQSAVKGAEGFIDTVGAPAPASPSRRTTASSTVRPTKRLYAFIPLSTVRALSEGPHTISVRGKDAAGNWGVTTPTTLVVDKTNPAVSGVIAAPNPTSGAATVTLTATATDPDPAGAGVPSNIARAEWYRGTDPGAGNGTPMSAADACVQRPKRGTDRNNQCDYLDPGQLHTVRSRPGMPPVTGARSAARPWWSLLRRCTSRHSGTRTRRVWAAPRTMPISTPGTAQPSAGPSTPRPTACRPAPTSTATSGSMPRTSTCRSAPTRRCRVPVRCRTKRWSTTTAVSGRCTSTGRLPA